MSVEDPVEYDLPGITQIQVDPRRGITFASALRAILRQDPDVISVGEIRDLETAEMAVQASLTGHLVLATLHANDAVSSFDRLRDIGLEPGVIASTLRGAIAQRLMRRVCEYCAHPVKGALSPLEETMSSRYGVRPGVRPVGCARCGHTGYRGRFPIVEVMVTSTDIDALWLKRSPSKEIERAAVAAGMRTLREAALDRVRAGQTTLQELERVLGEAGDQVPTPKGNPLVLVVDDDPVNRLIVRGALEKASFRVIEAVDGTNALDHVRARTDVDLMVLDLDMPRVTGHQVLRELKSSVATAAMPVVVLTGLEDVGTEGRLLEDGADDYIRKPIDASLFVSRIKAALRRTRDIDFTSAELGGTPPAAGGKTTA